MASVGATGSRENGSQRDYPYGNRQPEPMVDSERVLLGESPTAAKRAPRCYHPARNTKVKLKWHGPAEPWTEQENHHVTSQSLFFSFTSRAGSSQLVLVTRDSTPAFHIPAALLPQAVVLFRQMAHCILDRPVIDQPPPSKLCHAASLFSTQSSIALYGSTELG